MKLKDPTLKIIEDFITEWEAIKRSNKDAEMVQKVTSVKHDRQGGKKGNPKHSRQ